MSPQYPIQKHQSPQPIAAVLMWLKWSLLSEQLFQLLRQVLFALVQNQMAVRCIRRVQLQQRAGQLLFSDRQAVPPWKQDSIAWQFSFETEILEITLQKQFNIF